MDPLFSFEDDWVFFLHQDLYKTAIEFLKLEKIELGGVRGSNLSSMVTQIYDEVFELVKVFAECKYDPLDPGDSVSRRMGGPAGPMSHAPGVGRHVEGELVTFWRHPRNCTWGIP